MSKTFRSHTFLTSLRSAATVATFTILTHLASGQTWSIGAPFPSEARDDGASFVIGDAAYCGTGVLSWGGTTIDFYRFLFDAQTWTQVASMPDGADRQYACGFSNGLRGYIFGGFRGGAFLNDFWSYNPSTDSWTELSPLPADPRSGATSFVIGQSAYVVGGKNTSAASLSEVWRYDMTAEVWQQMGDLPFSSWRAAGAAINGKGYLAFGVDTDLNFSDELWSYDPVSDNWSQLASLPEGPRNYAALYTLGSDLLAFAGFSPPSTFYNDAWRFNVADNIWEASAVLPADGRRGGMTFQSDAAAYYTSGLLFGGIRTNETWALSLPAAVAERKPEAFKLSPNPTNQYVQWSSSLSVNGTARIYSAQGILVGERLLSPSKNQLDVSNLTPGYYFVTLPSTEAVKLGRFVKY